MQLQFDSDINTQTAQFIGFSTLAARPVSDPWRIGPLEMVWFLFKSRRQNFHFSNTHTVAHTGWVVQFFGAV